MSIPNKLIMELCIMSVTRVVLDYAIVSQSYILFSRTDPPSYVLFGGIVLPSYILLGGTVPPNNFSQNGSKIRLDGLNTKKRG